MELFLRAGWVAWPLGLCSILALGIILERLVTLTRLKQVEERAVMVLQLALEKGDDAMLRDPQIASAPVTQVVTMLNGMRGTDAESLTQSADIALALQRLRLRRYLGTLATIGSISPFVGLFGTVLGVMSAFRSMSQSGLSGETIAGGISEALSATALGLLVAIPSVMAYNYFVGRVNGQFLHVQGHVARLLPLLKSARRERVEV